MVSVIVSSLQLCRSGDGGAVLDTGCFSLLKGQGVAGGDGPVMKHNSCKQKDRVLVSPLGFQPSLMSGAGN